MPSPSRQQLAFFSGALVLVLAVVFWFTLAELDNKAHTPIVPAKGSPPALAQAPKQPPNKANSAVPAQRKNELPASTKDPKSRFEELNRYTNGTRSIDMNDYDALNPGARYETKQPLSRNPMSVDAGWEMLFTADRFYIVGDETVVISLDLWLDDQPFAMALPDMKAEVVSDNGLRQQMWLEVEPTASGAIALFKPDSYWSDVSGPMKVTATLSGAGIDGQLATLDFHFTGSDRIPAKFSSVIDDYIEAGNLVFSIGVGVRVAGDFRITANIHDRNGRPFGSARFEGPMAPGSQVATVSFYGLLFHDANAEGPYYLTTLRGERINPLSLSGSDLIPNIEATYISHDYPLQQFRTTVAPSPRRTRMLEHYRKAEAKGVKLTPNQE